MNSEIKIMERPASTKQKNSATMPYQKIRVEDSIKYILRLPGGQRMIYSLDTSFRVWDLKRGMEVGEEWVDKDFEVEAMALSPDGKTVTTRNRGGAVQLWNINTGKTFAGHTDPSTATEVGTFT
ncbi:hypothetical protein BDR04DRAFT_315811 [Suillus decipiens]|nr:hypothetical protein BDR04DRAFT_315811 [Suillus decipiens]